MVTRAVALAAVPLTVPTVQTPVVPVIVGMTPALVAAVTVKVEAEPAEAGAPVKETVGAIFAAVVVCVLVAAR